MWLLLAACLRPTPPPTAAEPAVATRLRGELVTEGPLPARLAGADGADLVLFYAGEHRGALDTCGCPKRPRGGLARLAAYVRAAREAAPGVPDLLLHTGAFLDDAIGLDGTLREDVPLVDRWMLEGLAMLDPDAVQVAGSDLPGLEALPDGAPLPPLVSAVFAPRDPGVAPRPAPWRIFELGGHRVGVTGIAGKPITFASTDGWRQEDPRQAGERAVDELVEAGADVVVLLAYDATEAARDLARERPEIDVVIDTRQHRTWDPPFEVGGALWVRSHHQGMRVGELRLHLDEAGRVTDAVDRQVDLDPEVPDEAALAEHARRAREAIDAVQARLFGP